MKQRVLKNEDGYSFFIALLVSVLFIVLAVSLLSVTMAGLTKSTTREKIVQSTELADKGMTHIIQAIHTELQDAVNPEGLPSEEFKMQLEGTLEDYRCDGGNKKLTIETETGKYEACIVAIEDEPGNPLRKIVTLESTGIVNDKKRTVTFAVKIGADPVPDALNYALGVHKTCTRSQDCIDGEGNLFLHGASEIVGDLKVDGNIITTDRAYVYLNGEKWIESLYPSIKSRHAMSSARLVLAGKIYTFSNRPSYNTHITRTNFNASGYKQATVGEAFSDPPRLVQRSPVRQKIEITEQRQNYRFRINDAGVVKLNSGSDRTYQNEQHSGKKVFAYHRSCTLLIFCEDRTDGNYIMKGNNVFGQFATDGNLTIREGKATFENGLYVHGNLTIGNPNISQNEYNPDKYETIEISGPIYVNGDVKIIGANVKFNSLIYVNGDTRRNANEASVEIRNSQINGLQKDGKEGSLIIFANKEIKIYNNSVNQNVPSRIRGFFYSEDTLEMFGVGSNLRIEGGISARRIVLNAIRGRSSSTYFSGAQQITGNDYFEGKANQVGKNSRLTIIYNPEIINTYSDLKGQEPVIFEVSPPKIIERN